MENKYRFVKRWKVPKTLSSKQMYIIKFNEIIDFYNDWQIHDDFNPNKIEVLLDNIDFLKSRIKNKEILEEVEKMEDFVKSFEI
jgi:hypothetical protein